MINNNNFTKSYVLIRLTVKLNDPSPLGDRLSAYPLFRGTFSSLEEAQKRLITEQKEYEDMVIYRGFFYEEDFLVQNKILKNIRKNSYIRDSLIDKEIQGYDKIMEWEGHLTQIASFSYSSRRIKKKLGEQYWKYYIMKVIKPQ